MLHSVTSCLLSSAKRFSPPSWGSTNAESGALGSVARAHFTFPTNRQTNLHFAVALARKLTATGLFHRFLMRGIWVAFTSVTFQLGAHQ